MQIFPWQGVGKLTFGMPPSEVEAAIGSALETRDAEAWTICDYGSQELSCASYHLGQLAAIIVAPAIGTTLWDTDLENITQAEVEMLLEDNGHQFVRRPRIHPALRDAITAPTAGLFFTFADGRCDAVDVQAATLTNLRHMRKYFHESNTDEAIVKSLDDMLVAIGKA